MPQNWEEFQAERPSWKDFKAARRTSACPAAGGDRTPTWAEFLENASDCEEWVLFWNGVAAAQGSEPSASAKLKRMAKWYKKNMDESFDHHKAIAEAKGSDRWRNNNLSCGDSDYTDTSKTGRGSRDSVRSRSSGSGSVGSTTTTGRFASWGRAAASHQPSTSENMQASLGPLIEMTHYAKREPLMAARWALYTGLLVSLIPTITTDSSGRPWYFRVMCIAMAGSGVDMMLSPHFNAAGLLQLVSVTEPGHILLFAAMHFFRVSGPTSFALLPLMFLSVVGANQLADDPRSPPAIRYFPRGALHQNKEKLLNTAAVLEVLILPLQTYYWITGSGSIVSLLAYTYTYLRMRFITKATHRIIWGGVHTFIRRIQAQHSASIPPQINNGITSCIGFIQRLMPNPLPPAPLY